MGAADQGVQIIVVAQSAPWVTPVEEVINAAGAGPVVGFRPATCARATGDSGQRLPGHRSLVCFGVTGPRMPDRRSQASIAAGTEAHVKLCCARCYSRPGSTRLTSSVRIRGDQLAVLVLRPHTLLAAAPACARTPMRA